MATAKKNIKVERGTFEYNGKTCNEYFISAKVRGVDLKIKLTPPDPKDRGGYSLLDVVFAGENEAEFVVEPFEFQDDTGKVIAGDHYLVRTVDKETGEVYECSVKPARKSDKQALGLLLR